MNLAAFEYSSWLRLARLSLTTYPNSVIKKLTNHGRKKGVQVLDRKTHSQTTSYVNGAHCSLDVSSIQTKVNHKEYTHLAPSAIRLSKTTNYFRSIYLKLNTVMSEYAMETRVWCVITRRPSPKAFQENLTQRMLLLRFSPEQMK